MSLFQPRPAQLESLVAEQQAFDEAQAAKARADQEKISRRWLCDYARDVAMRKATHTIDNDPATTERIRHFSDWAAISRDEPDQRLVQAAIHMIRPNPQVAPIFVEIKLRIKDTARNVHSESETVLGFNLYQDKAWTYIDGEPRPINPGTVQYDETRQLLLTLDSADYEDTQEPLIGL